MKNNIRQQKSGRWFHLRLFGLLLLQRLSEAVLEGNNTVEAALLPVLHIVAHADELETFPFLGILERRLQLAARQLFQRIRIEIIQIIRSLRNVNDVPEGTDYPD